MMDHDFYSIAVHVCSPTEIEPVDFSQKEAVAVAIFVMQSISLCHSTLEIKEVLLMHFHDLKWFLQASFSNNLVPLGWNIDFSTLLPLLNNAKVMVILEVSVASFKTRQDKTTLFNQGSPVSCKAGILRGPGFNKTYVYTFPSKCGQLIDRHWPNEDHLTFQGL